MQSTQLVSAFAEIAREKDVDRDTLQLIVEDTFRAMIRKRYGADDEDAFQIIFNPDQGDIQILHLQEVVPDFDVEDPVTQLGLSEAIELDEDYELGDEVASTITIEDFGRRTITMALQTFRQRIRDIEKENTYTEYSQLIGEIVVGEVYQTRRREILVIHNKTELLLPREHQIYKDRYRKGDMLRAVVHDVMRESGPGPQVVISRTEPIFLERLFELEVPEIYDGIVEIKKVVREPGDRAKVAVVSHDDRVDPVGACVGVKGSRIHAVVRELANENIDVVMWTDDEFELIKRALAPARPVSVSLNKDINPPRAKVEVPAEEVSLAIGRGGQNIRLASRLAGYEIDVYRDIAEDEEDVDITEFSDVIPPEIVSRLSEIGCDTAKAVLELSEDELARRSGLPRVTAEKILLLMRIEFAEDERERDRLTAEATELEQQTTELVEQRAADGGAASPEPEAASPEPEAASPEPEAASPEPEPESPEPEAASPEPEPASPEAEAASPDTEAASPEPEAASPEPEAASPEVSAPPAKGAA